MDIFSDIPIKFPEKPVRLIDQIRALIRTKNMAFAPGLAQIIDANR